MKNSALILRTSLVASLFALLLAPAAQAQTDPNIGRAAIMQAEAANKAAHASLISAAALYEKSQAEIARLYQDTYEKAVNNDVLEAESFYKKRAAYHAYHAAQKAKPDQPSRHLTQARTASTGSMARPNGQQLASPSGEIAWPTIFRGTTYDVTRRQIDTLMRRRTPENSGAGSQNCIAIAARLESLKSALRENIQQYNSLDYLTARNFVDAVAIEAQRPLAPKPAETLDKVAGK